MKQLKTFVGKLTKLPLQTKLSKIFTILRREGFLIGTSLILKKLVKKMIQRVYVSKYRQSEDARYSTYMELEKQYIQALLKESKVFLNKITFKPLFSVVMPVYNVDKKWLKRAIESVRKQIYPHWELCIADDASTKPYIRRILKRYTRLDSRIKVIFRDKNGGISSASNSALELATGDYIAFLDHDDELSPHALYENAILLNDHPEADYIYSDEDKIDKDQNRFDHHFKPNWSPELIYSCMYSCHLGVFRTGLIRQIGGLRSEYDGSQDHDLVLRVTDFTRNIFHIPKILYHWRAIPTSCASGPVKEYACLAGIKAVQDKLNRQNVSAKVEFDDVLRPYCYRVHYEIFDNPLVSIIIPSAGKLLKHKAISALENNLQAIISKTSYPNWEIIIVDGHDLSDVLLNSINNLTKFKLISCGDKFNFSQRVNLGVNQACGEYLLILNDDTQPINTDWLKSLLQFAQLESIGAVGAKLLYPDHRIQHVGVILPNMDLMNFSHLFYGQEEQKITSTIYTSVYAHLPRNFLAVTGACLMVKHSLFEEVGKFNEELPLNYNDVDFCLKLHRSGYRNIYTPYAKLYHYESLTRKAGVERWEIEYMQNYWTDYIKSLGGHDPYYNTNFSKTSIFCELSV